MRIFLVVLFVLLISDTITKPRGMRRCCRAMHCRCGEPKPTTLDEIREQLDNNKRKIEANGLKIDYNGRKIKDPRSVKRTTHCCRSRHCRNASPGIRCEPSTRRPPTLDKIRQKLDDNGRKIDANGRKINVIVNDITVMDKDILKNGRKIDAILENVSDLKKNRSIDYYEDPYADDYEEYGSGLSSGNGPKDKSKLLSGKVDTLLEKMSDLKTTIDNAMEGKMRDANQNEDNPSTNPRIKPAKNLPHQENEEPGSSGSGSGDKE